MKKKKVIVADDDRAVLDVLQIMLEDSNYYVKTVSDGNVIPKVEEDLPDLVLMDVSMPHVDGRDLCRELKNSEETKRIPVIMLSASYNVDKSSFEAGADDFIAKPFDMYELLEKVEKYTH